MPCVRHLSFVRTQLLQSRPVGYSKLRVPFLFLLSSPLLFSPTTDLHWTSRGADGSHCNTPCLDWVVWLSSVINYSFKHHTSVFIHFTQCFDSDQIRCFRMAFPLGKWVLCWWKVIKWVLQNSLLKLEAFSPAWLSDGKCLSAALLHDSVNGLQEEW